MLREYRNGSIPSRRWFGDDYFDLIIWYGVRDDIIGFQLCYDKGMDEHSLTWSVEGTLLHSRIDDGEDDPSRNMSPILVPDGVVPYQHLLRQFKERAAGLEPEIFDLVLRRLEDAAPAA